MTRHPHGAPSSHVPDRVGLVWQRFDELRERADWMVSQAERLLNLAREQASRPSQAVRPDPAQASHPAPAPDPARDEDPGPA
jgi:hypothetical protein